LIKIPAKQESAPALAAAKVAGPAASTAEPASTTAPSSPAPKPATRIKADPKAEAAAKANPKASAARPFVKAESAAAASKPRTAVGGVPRAAADKAAAAPLTVTTNPAPLPTRMTSSAKSKASAKAQAAYAAPAPMPIPTSRFADRFAPPRPPTRQMGHLEDDNPKHPHKFDPKLANAWKTKTGRELSEPELLAMPDSEYMNEKQLEYFRTTLQRLKDDLLSNAGETTEHLREDTSIVPDPADRATIEEEHALELRTRDRERKLLKKISQSLARIESGEYGFCDETGEPIGLGRLLARPTATLSLEAQQRRELKQKMFGD
jgi:DnaK suppressor protein